MLTCFFCGTSENKIERGDGRRRHQNELQSTYVTMSMPLKMSRTTDEQYAIVRAYTAEQREEDRARIRKTGATRMATIHAAAKAEWDAKVAAAMQAEKAAKAAKASEKEKCPSHCIQIPSNDDVHFASQAPQAPRAYHFQSQQTDPW